MSKRRLAFGSSSPSSSSSSSLAPLFPLSPDPLDEFVEDCLMESFRPLPSPVSVSVSTRRRRSGKRTRRQRWECSVPDMESCLELKRQELELKRKLLEQKADALEWEKTKKKEFEEKKRERLDLEEKLKRENRFRLLGMLMSKSGPLSAAEEQAKVNLIKVLCGPDLID